MTDRDVVPRVLSYIALLSLLGLAAWSCSAPPPGGPAPSVEDAAPGVYLAAFGDVVVPVRFYEDRFATAPILEVALAEGEHTVTVDGDRFYAVDARAKITEQRPFAEAEPRPLQLTEFPSTFGFPNASVWSRQRHLFIGSRDLVTQVHFDREPPYSEVVWLGHLRKPIDFFVTAGDTLLAIDNLVIPKYAIGIDIADVGNPQVEFEARLPDVPNSHFVDGVALDESSVLLIVTSTTMLGPGNNLFRVTITDRGELEAVEVYSERFMRFADGERPNGDGLGETFSRFHGVDRLGETLFLAVDARGIFTASRDDPSTWRQHQLDGQRCLDVRANAEANVLFALLAPYVDEETEENEQRRTLVAYRVDENGELHEIARYELDATVNRLSK